MSDWLTAVLLGVIEGITEFLPVSSTGHLLIAEQWLPRQSDFYNVVIQSAAVLAVIPLFRQRWRFMLQAGRDPAARAFALKVLVAFVVTGIGGVLLEAAGFELPETVTPVASALLIGGVLFLVVEKRLAHGGSPPREEITWTVALAVGAAQLVAAVFPGASRSGSTILVMLLLGLSRPLATEFSFLVGIPTMLAAGGLKLAGALGQVAAGQTTENWPALGLAFVVSAIVSFIAVKWLLRFVQSHTFVGFGWYRIGLGVLLLLRFTP